MSATKIVLGMDPGISGGIALLRNGDFASVTRMPIEAKPKKGNQIDARGLLEVVRSMLSAAQTEPRESVRLIVAVERVHAMPFQGVSSMFSLGDSFGCCRIAAASFGDSARVELVEPTAWKKFCKLTGKQKKYSVTRARSIFPTCRPWVEDPKKDEGLAEALLIAHYADRAL